MFSCSLFLFTLIFLCFSGILKRTGSPKREPDSLYCRDSPWINSPWISSYHIQNSFQLNITDITHVYNITWIYLLHNPTDCNTNLRVQAPWAKRKQTEIETISSLLGKFHLHESSPQAARSVAWAIPHILFLCHLDNSFTRTLIYQAIPKDGIYSCKYRGQSARMRRGRIRCGRGLRGCVRLGAGLSGGGSRRRSGEACRQRLCWLVEAPPPGGDELLGGTPSFWAEPWSSSPP